MARVNPLGLALESLLRPVVNDPQMMPQGISAVPPIAPVAPPVAMPPVAPPSPKLSKGRLIAGILADAFMGAAGRPGIVAPMWANQREQQQQQAQWGLRRRAELEDYEAKQRIEQRYRPPDVSPMARDVATWGAMTPEQRTAYGQMKQAGAGDPDVFVTLPNGQVYVGPKSGLAAALTGGGTAAPPKPVGRLTPVEGGPTPPASGAFRP